MIHRDIVLAQLTGDHMQWYQLFQIRRAAMLGLTDLGKKFGSRDRWPFAKYTGNKEIVSDHSTSNVQLMYIIFAINQSLFAS